MKNNDRLKIALGIFLIIIPIVGIVLNSNVVTYFLTLETLSGFIVRTTLITFLIIEAIYVIYSLVYGEARDRAIIAPILINFMANTISLLLFMFGFLVFIDKGLLPGLSSEIGTLYAIPLIVAFLCNLVFNMRLKATRSKDNIYDAFLHVNDREFEPFLLIHVVLIVIVSGLAAVGALSFSGAILAAGTAIWNVLYYAITQPFLVSKLVK